MTQPKAAIALFLALVSCASNTPGSNDYGDGKAQPTPGRSTRAPARNSPQGTEQPNPIPGYRGTPQTSGDAGTLPASYNDKGAVGSAAATYLRASPARSMLVEIDYVTSRRPSEGAVDHLREILEREADKPAGLDVRVDDEIQDERDRWSLQDVRALESRHRSGRSGGERATMWVVFLSGSLAGEEGTLGVAYEATGAALFPDEIRDAATALVGRGAIERAALTHEAGHLLGLVNLAVKSKHDHEDPDHPGHSRYEDSVMFWAIEDDSIATLLSGGPPDDFDRYDRDDLRAIRES